MTVRNALSVVRKLESLPNGLQSRIGDALEASAAEMHRMAVVRVQKHESAGRVYRRGRRTHTASSPGAYPNTDTGALVNSMRSERRGNLLAIFGAFILYAKHLEFGTSHMAARPFMRPTFAALRESATARVAAAVREAMRGYASAR